MLAKERQKATLQSRIWSLPTMNNTKRVCFKNAKLQDLFSPGYTAANTNM